jgi:hypothetical protein
MSGGYGSASDPRLHSGPGTFDQVDTRSRFTGATERVETVVSGSIDFRRSSKGGTFPIRSERLFDTIE